MTERRARMRYDEAVSPAHEVRLKGRTPRAKPATSPGCMAVISLPFIAAGVAIIGAATGWLPTKATSDSPAWVMGAGGVIFAAAGVLVLCGAIRQLLENSRKSGLRRARPGEPWLVDYPWSARSATDGNAGIAASGFLAFLFLQVFLIPFNWWAFFSSHGNFFVIGVVGVFDVVSFFMLGHAGYHALRVLKYGTSTLTFHRFPFFLGETVEASFRTSADVRQLKRLVFTLRCLREQVDAQAVGTGVTMAIFEIWREERVVEPPSREIPVSFRLPAEAHFSTTLAIATPRYWELEVEGEAPGVDFGARFLLPVYGKAVES